MRILSLGAGVQSSSLALMAKHGEAPMPDAAIFADTQGEPEAVYRWLDWLRGELPFPVHVVSHGDLWASATRVRTSEKSGQKYIETSLPVFTKDGLKRGMGQRHCTLDFKINAITREARRLLGKTRINGNSGVLVEMMIGISIDEADRMKPNPAHWISNTWPLIDLGMDREDCKAWMLDMGYPEPPRSACTFCPFHSDEEWLALTPEEFTDAVEKEMQLQAAYAQVDRLDSVPYFHESRIPLSQVKLKAKRKGIQLNMFRNECAGFCGV